MRLAGLAGEGGDALFEAADRTEAELVVVIVASDSVPAAQTARGRGIDTVVVDGDGDGDAGEPLAEYGVDLALLDRYTGAYPEEGPLALTVDRTLRPESSDAGPAAAVERGHKVAGATVRPVPETAGTPDPAVLTQEPVLVYSDDDAMSLAGRLDRAGGIALARAVRAVTEGRANPAAGTIRGDVGGQLPARWLGTGDHVRDLRYGENPHQDAAVYERVGREASVIDARQLNDGAKELSYNNYNDADAALSLVREFEAPAAAVIKHTNPAGCATADSIAEAYDRALSTDPMSAFGGVVALNRPCDHAAAEAVTESFKEVVVAPGYTDDALAVLREADSLRVLDVGDLLGPDRRPPTVVERPIAGGRLLQERDDQRLSPADLEVVTEREPTDEQVETMLFAWQVVKHVKSNAIVFADGTETVGVGAGQMSRVDAVRIAAMKAEEHAEGKAAEGAVMASDAFFPFPDGVERAAEAGIEAVVQPGGSVNDDDVIEAADELGLAMAMTGQRAFRHD
jgi:phosphoribosylaminoimidazolecarboxamide formyltransferase/IMP cyclohydrolase